MAPQEGRKKECRSISYGWPRGEREAPDLLKVEEKGKKKTCATYPLAREGKKKKGGRRKTTPADGMGWEKRAG